MLGLKLRQFNTTAGANGGNATDSSAKSRRGIKPVDNSRMRNKNMKVQNLSNDQRSSGGKKAAESKRSKKNDENVSKSMRKKVARAPKSLRTKQAKENSLFAKAGA